MMMADQASQFQQPPDEFFDFGNLEFSIDELIGNSPEPDNLHPDSFKQAMLEDSLPNDMRQVGYSDFERSSASTVQVHGDNGVFSSSISEASDSRTGISEGSSDSAGNSILNGSNLGLGLPNGIPVQDNGWSCLDMGNVPWGTSSNVLEERSFLNQAVPNNFDFDLPSHSDKMLNLMGQHSDHSEGVQRAPEHCMTTNFCAGEFGACYNSANQTALNSSIWYSTLMDSNADANMLDMPTVSDLSNSLCPASVDSLSNSKLFVHPKHERDALRYDTPSHQLDNFNLEKNVLVPQSNHQVDVKGREPPVSLSSTSMKQQQFIYAKLEKGKRRFYKVNGSRLSMNTHQKIQRNLLPQRIHSEEVDDDDDLCILEDISAPAKAKANPYANSKSPVFPQRTTITDSFTPPVEVGPTVLMRPKSSDEHAIFRVALQDLSQPKSEESPPDGLLAVPLLRHQRIALSWMVKKEKSGVPCCGGILADDQGLGKTVSTIALLLKERSPSLRVSTGTTMQTKTETLNLDDDDVDKSKLGSDSCHINENSCKSSSHAKGRPAAGTLIVCPTSVLRQWSDELHNKVTSKANLSVLVYHGGNRTKDPIELAKYDVVVTTYSIVSMEVPKQPLVENEDETGKGTTCHESSPNGFSSKKRKSPPSSKKRSSKAAKKEVEKELLEATARPLARVAWYRVVLDEAQSIKNYRTQVARACWGLRAKRRWCLSGTPIQNAVDDLYSYFRFLKYDPYAVFKQFCSTIKVPIQRHPTTGYRKLQAVLKTVMLRRTKGTFIDGEPIINLPPKRIVLRKVDFTDEERDFYCRLETESRAQFAEYAAAGTVKQNYVNILLMLLRLRQACDHPLLVGGSSPSSIWRSSTEEAKKLPQEKLALLLNHLEASLAICGICNDPPEDAVVTVCGHVFCNQCICEHLSGDDAKCPVAACKTQLSGSSVFSKAMLSGSSDQPSPQMNPNSDGSEVVQSSVCGPFDSSKIKAALQVLQSLSKPKADEAASPSDDTCKNESRRTTVVGEKAIVFSQWTGMLDLLEACLKSSSIQYRRLDGTMSVLARDKAVKDFNTLPEVSVMIMSLKAASLGLNMVAACHVLLLDLWWNPTTEDQAIDRAHRIGQTRPVTVLRLTVKDTVEDRILALQQKKREMVASAFGEDETGSRQTRLTVEDLEYLFKI